MKVSKKGLDLIKKYEGCRLESYRDVVGVWTIGYGITSAARSVTGTAIGPGMRITQAQADKWLEDSVNGKYGANVMKFDGIYHWTQEEYDALCSFAYNVGSVNGLTANGTRTRAQIADAMLQYDKAGGKRYSGLARRRREERELFLSGSGAGRVPSETPKYVIGGTYATQVNLNVREKATTGSKILKTLPKGSKVECLGGGVIGGDTWMRTKDGWIAAHYKGKAYVK